MKKLLTLLLLPLLLIGCATMMGAEAPSEMRTMEKIIKIPNTSQDEIYIKSNSWFVETFNSAESVIQFQDKESGKIMGKYIFSYNEGLYSYKAKQTINIDIKEGKIRIIINDPYYKTISGGGQTYQNTSYLPLKTQKGIDRVRIEWESLIDSLEEYLQTDSSW